MAWWTFHPRWAVVHSRAGARWIAAALASFVLLGYVVWSHRGSDYSPGSGFIQNLLPLGNKPTAANGAASAPLPAWIDTPATFDTAGDAKTAELDRSLALHPRLLPAIQAFLARPVLSHDQALPLNEAHCPRAQLDEQVNKDQLSGEHDHWTSLTAENVIEMRRAAVEFLERRAGEEGEGALLGPGFGPEGVVVEKGSRGVVIAAGNKRTVERAAVCIEELQRLGWKGGVEVWHFEGELEGEKERELLERLGVGIHMVSTKKAPGQWKNFELKAEAILRSSFDEVLFLDSDNFPLSDVSALFDAPLFTDPRGGRAIFWPDLNRDHPDNAIHRVLGIPCHKAWQLDSGQILIAKSGNDGLNLAALYLASHMQTEGGYWFSGGDKDTFRYAFLTLGIPYTPAPRWLAVLGSNLKRGQGDLFCGAAMLQYGIAPPPTKYQDSSNPTHPEPLFVHANLLKHMSGVKQGQAFPHLRRLSLTQDDVRVDGQTALDSVVGGAQQISGRGLCSDIWAFRSGVNIETVDASVAFGGLLDGFEARYGGRAGSWK
ncbi:hypothetical protein N0V93_003149 [Gnomoniopsis smithogilvyi]|uniref:Uncharacterized protein n=1 Tax=Gnomoniopsis smithogilvyi TaxID=1191159 RepID=A0A9W8YWK4_9PEZI|nr:hypothetical protein N0V93_003149 [Gnomoniopsis smithogilvyi]